MRWPWVSRRAYDEVVRQRERLEKQNDELLDHLTRLKRVQHDLAEVKIERPKPIPVQVPEPIRNMLQALSSVALRRDYQQRIIHEHRQNVKRGIEPEDSWARLESELAQALGLERMPG